MANILESDCTDEVPKINDPFIQKYFHGRDALIFQEQKLRSDHTFRQSLSPVAAEASEVVSCIRDEEQRTTWTSKFEDSLAEDGEGNIYPGMMFTLAKSRMEKTKLWRIVRRMPKGALLHAHLDAMADLDFVFAKAFSADGIHIYSPDPLCSPSALEKSPVFFQFSRGVPRSTVSIWSPEYRPSTLVPLSVAADDFPNGGRDGFLAWIKGRCSITARESLNHHHGPNAVWQKFKSTFMILGSIIFYEPIFRAFVREMCRQLLDDGVRWVDVRAAFIFQYRREGSEVAEEGYEEMIRVFGEEIENFKASREGKDFWGARMIWTSLRNLERREIVESMKQCISVKMSYPHLIAGFDLVGQEDQGRTLKDLTPELFWFRKRCVEEGIEIPFFFHAGECLGDGDETDQNLFDALLLGTRRIGHGFSLYKHPLLIDMIKEKKILVESCPISNEVLRLTGSIMSHPLPALLARGVPVALCNDDPSILGQETNGMTHDFWQALQGWKNLGLEGLGALAENSVRWAAFEDQSTQDWVRDIKDASFGNGVRALRVKQWRIEWEAFCEWVVAEFGGQAGEDS
ncbi:hypothetical protein FGG08_003426 [Glutinoglossum americanum]|uniref:adenosine deaminase n=1 Tax=Glutinoglossum americanum TaxID=1670608 RepID=A0A9P8KY36_9PEZI|nr:hypothetical protein FGG08_003426 [Glutinoglossum americanum]